MTTRRPEDRIILVYGSFADPATGANFFMLRVPSGRLPWSKKIAPALHRLIRSWLSHERIAADRAYRQRYGYSAEHWNVEGQDREAWSVTMCSRFIWTGTELQDAGRSVKFIKG